jgi:hypothetical protein
MGEIAPAMGDLAFSYAGHCVPEFLWVKWPPVIAGILKVIVAILYFDTLYCGFHQDSFVMAQFFEHDFHLIPTFEVITLGDVLNSTRRNLVTTTSRRKP